jgi:hypothetical protein
MAKKVKAKSHKE